MLPGASCVENMPLVLPDVEHIDETDAPDLGCVDNSLHNAEIHMDVNKSFYCLLVVSFFF